MKRIIIVGAGASGLAAAIEAGTAGADVTVLEAGKRAGKKLLSTGNGRCNLTNLDIGTGDGRHDTAKKIHGLPDGYRDLTAASGHHPKEWSDRTDEKHNEKEDSYAVTDYHSRDIAFARGCISRFSGEDAVRWFGALGIPCVSKGALVYPRSLQAASVLDALRFKAEEAGVRFIFESKVRSVDRIGKEFTVFAESRSYNADAVIISTGGRAMPSSGSDGSGAVICHKLGHTIIPEAPALVPLKCGGLPFSSIAGIRAQADVKAFCGKRLLAEDEGELQFTAYGISGIPVMQISGAVSRALYDGGRCFIEIDLVPEMTEEALARLIEDRVSGFSGRTCSQLLLGLLPRKLYEALLKNSGVRLQQDIGEYFIDKKDRLDKKRIAAVVHMLKHLRVQAEGTMGWDHAQVTSGGVDVSEIDAAAMESKLVPGLYITGELMDVDGPCGGYNLHWAWATGILAGRSAATKCG